MDPRQRARRNLVFFWLAVLAIPVLVVWGWVTFHIGIGFSGY